MKLILKITCLLALTIYSQTVLAQLKTYSFEEVDTVLVKKPIVVFLHTNWCKHCKAMQKETFTNTLVIKELNDNYYYIPFNAESKEPITFKGKTYNYKATNAKRGIHALAEDIGIYLKRVKYPSLIVLNKNKEIVHSYRSKLRPKGLLRLLNDIRVNEEL